ncbi:MAG: EAL domain-containing protein, partial [Gammaproteobacteria bacterium]
FEIPETVADGDYSSALNFMHALKNRLGCRLSLDDIGIGSSNLANLAKYDVDYFKIDGTFAADVLTNPYYELVIKFITIAAEMFGKKTVAEHIENLRQIEKITALGVDFSQGYFTGKPQLLFDPNLDE